MTADQDIPVFKSLNAFLELNQFPFALFLQ